MPPELLTTSWIGLANEVLAETKEPMIEYRYPLRPPQAEDQSSTGQWEQSTYIPPTAQVTRDPSSPVPSAVAVRPPVPLVSKGSGPTLQIRQLWEGTVIDVRDGQFVATLSDKTSPSNPDEQAVFECSEISFDDRHLVGPGSVFYWAIGTESTPAGQLRNVSSIEFRRVPAWTRSALQRAENRVSHLKELFQSEL